MQDKHYAERPPSRVAIAHTKETHRSQDRVLGLVREALGHL